MGSSPRIVVARCCVADVDLVAPLFDAYRRFYGLPADLAKARQYLAARLTRNESLVLVARAQRDPDLHPPDVAGFAQLYRSFSSLALGRIIVLNDVFVAEPWRGCGVARRLVHATEAYARSSGAVRIDVATQETNATALRLYASCGFARDAEFAYLSREV